MESKIYYNHKNQPVGEMRNGIYLKRVDPKKHFMKIYRGYGISLSVFEELKRNGCKEVRINTGEDLYKISIEDYELHSIIAKYEDPQIFCPLKWFISKNNNQEQLKLI